LFKLWRREILVSKWAWLLLLLAYLLYGTLPYRVNPFSVVLAIAFLLGLNVAPLFFEDIYKTEGFFSCLPVKRSRLVLSRYGLAAILVAAGGGLVFSYGKILDLLFGTVNPAERGSFLLSPQGFLGFLGTTVFLLSLFFPLFFRLGLGRGLIGFSILLSGVIIALDGMGMVLAAINRSGEPQIREYFQKPWLGLVRLLEAIKESTGFPLFVLLVLVFLAGTTLVSLRLSIRFYEKREF
jgi:hypothetical protein